MRFVQDMEEPCSSNFIAKGDFEYWTFLEILEFLKIGVTISCTLCCCCFTKLLLLLLRFCELFLSFWFEASCVVTVSSFSLANQS